MPAEGYMSDTRDFGGLRASDRSRSASRATQRHAAFALALLAGCAAAGPKPDMGGSIDFTDDAGHLGTLAGLKGRVVVVDLCVSWATACNVNAKVLDDAAAAVPDAAFVTLLVDEGDVGKEALRAYRELLGVKHPVLLAGPRVRAGTSVLGDTGYVPRLVILDEDGRVRVDDSGGVVSLEGLVKRVNASGRGPRAGP
jgi:hypothetical protein